MFMDIDFYILAAEFGTRLQTSGNKWCVLYRHYSVRYVLIGGSLYK
jgi:hypothetical protein